MNGWLIYTDESAKRNKDCIKLYLDEAINTNLNLRLKIEGSFNLQNEKLPDFAIMRGYNYHLSRYLEEHNVKVFNNSFVSEICNDKEKTYKYALTNNIPVMETKRYDKNAPLPFDFPFVVKPACGHGGKCVSLVSNKSEFEKAILQIKSDKILLQKKSTETGKDLRVYVIGNKIICSMLRKSEKDFRSNFSLGGNATMHTLSNDELRLANNVMKIFNFDYAGIDMIYHNGKPILNEIEDVVGARMVYKNTDINIIGKYMEYISNSF